jgi:elongator complex protein 1
MIATLKLTPIRNANVPPPMALHELHLEKNGVDIAISQNSTQLATLDLTGLTIYNYDITAKSTKQPILHKRFSLPKDCGNPVQISMRANDQVYMLTHVAETNRDEVHFRRIVDVDWTRLFLDHEHIASIFSSQSYEDVYIQSSQGLILPVSDSPGSEASFKLPTLCPWTEMVQAKDEVYFDILYFRSSADRNSKSYSALLPLEAYMQTRSSLLQTVPRSSSHQHT